MLSEIEAILLQHAKNTAFVDVMGLMSIVCKGYFLQRAIQTDNGDVKIKVPQVRNCSPATKYVSRPRC